jgi:hypothetical protein
MRISPLHLTSRPRPFSLYASPFQSQVVMSGSLWKERSNWLNKMGENVQTTRIHAFSHVCSSTFLQLVRVLGDGVSWRAPSLSPLTRKALRHNQNSCRQSHGQSVPLSFKILCPQVRADVQTCRAGPSLTRARVVLAACRLRAVYNRRIHLTFSEMHRHGGQGGNGPELRTWKDETRFRQKQEPDKIIYLEGCSLSCAQVWKHAWLENTDMPTCLDSRSSMRVSRREGRAFMRAYLCTAH